jgi:hypothetical integral membrane protein (TIGR02206 family)
MQRAAIVFTLVAPLLLWVACRRYPTPRFRTIVRRTLAVLLLAFEIGLLGDKIASGGATLETVLPMHLCDWVLCAVAAALWFRWQVCFELGYFWGLAGTIQALITPAIDLSNAWWRLGGFFFSHALIVVSVLHLLITEHCRPWPRSFLRLAICSEIYVAAALLTNKLTGGNYGFLAHKPAQASLLDFFSDTHWLYVVQIHLVAFLFFPLLYLPWFVWDRLKPVRDS